MFLKRLMKKKVLFIFVLAAVFLTIGFLGAKFYLLINFLSGNDTVVKVSTNKEYLFLEHGDAGDITFESKVTTNPFCSASCNVKLLNLEDMSVIDADDFSLKPGNPFKKSYRFFLNKFGRGKEFYRFDVECISSGGFLCHSDRELTNRNLLITVEYDLNEAEEENKKIFEEKSRNLAEEINGIENELFTLKDAANKLNNSAIVDYDFEFNLNDKPEKIKMLAMEENYYTKIDPLLELEKEINETRKDLFDLNNTISGDVLIYNSLIDDLLQSEIILRNWTNFNFSLDSVEKIKGYIDEFNTIMKKFDERDYLENKFFFVNGFRDKIENYVFKEDENGTIVDKTIEKTNIQKIEFLNLAPDEVELKFAEIKNKCTVNNVTGLCSDGKNPVVFLHGHSVTKDAPLEYSLEGFTKLQKKLDEDGYVNAGSITLYTEKNVPANVWEVNTPLSIKASYYFDFFEEPENYKIVLTKSENIDTYAVRLKEIFDNVRFRTGKQKIDVIAFSMGGVVMRRHMQLFGGDGFSKVILLGAPNKGISGDVSTLCPIVGGEKRECEDMNANSLFMQKLNRDKIPDNLYNIYGTGCEMSEGKGDGIVLEESAKLETENNFAINGTCRGKFQPLHLDLLKIELYPEVYETIINILE